jgi:hypothetical protein
MKRKVFYVLLALSAIAILLLPALAFAEPGPSDYVAVPPITPADFASPDAHWIWQALAGSFVATLLAAAGRLIQSVIASIKDARIARACQFVASAVTVTYQEYVRVIKAKAADGKLTIDEKNEALQHAYRKALEIAQTEGFDLLKTLGKDTILALIEYFVGKSKAGAVAVPLPALPDLLPSA